LIVIIAKATMSSIQINKYTLHNTLITQFIPSNELIDKLNLEKKRRTLDKERLKIINYVSYDKSTV